MTAEAEVKQFIDRVLRLKEEQDTLSDDIREVYAEAKGRGYDKTAMGQVVAHLRKVDKLGSDAIAERETIFGMYLGAYETGTSVATHTHEAKNGYAKAKGVDSPNSPETANETQHPVSHATGAKAEMPARSGGDDSMVRVARTEAAAVTAGETAPNSPETATQLDDDAIAAVKDTVRLANVNDVEPSSSNAITPDPQPPLVDDGQPHTSSSPGSAKSDALSSIVGQGRDSGCNHTGSEEEQAVTNFEPPAFILKAAKLRPDCLKPDACAGYGSHQCHACTKAAGEVAA